VGLVVRVGCGLRETVEVALLVTSNVRWLRIWQTEDRRQKTELIADFRLRI
jgi:hypothetical protein